jgi:hypothetical protein
MPVATLYGRSVEDADANVGHSIRPLARVLDVAADRTKIQLYSVVAYCN